MQRCCTLSADTLIDKLEQLYLQEHGKPYENWLTDDTGKDRPLDPPMREWPGPN
jgi:hypothetical protein